VSVSNSTLAGNSASLGGGILSGSVNAPQVGSTIVAGNTGGSAPDVYETVSSQGHNLIGITDGSSGWTATDLTGSVASPLNALLGPLANNGGPTQTVALLPGSPAIDAGGDTGPSTDQRGLPRPSGLHFDIGAFEYQFPAG
jgi:hypothetical protein